MEEAWPDAVRIIGLFVADVGYRSGRTIIINPSLLKLPAGIADISQMQHPGSRPTQARRCPWQLRKLGEMLADQKIVVRMQDDQAIGCRGVCERGIGESERFECCLTVGLLVGILLLWVIISVWFYLCVVVD